MERSRETKRTCWAAVAGSNATCFSYSIAFGLPLWVVLINLCVLAVCLFAVFKLRPKANGCE